MKGGEICVYGRQVIRVLCTRRIASRHRRMSISRSTPGRYTFYHIHTLFYNRSQKNVFSLANLNYVHLPKLFDWDKN